MNVAPWPNVEVTLITPSCISAISFAIARPILTLMLWICYPLKIYGKENIKHDGNTVIICNHLCKMDVPMVGYLFKGKTYYLAKKEWFNNKFLAWIFSFKA